MGSALLVSSVCTVIRGRRSFAAIGALLCFLAVCSTGWAWSQTLSPNRQVSGNGVQASFHLGDQEGTTIKATDVLIVFNDNAKMPGTTPALLVQVIETNQNGQKTVFQSGLSPTFNHSQSYGGTLNVKGDVTVIQQPNSGYPQMRDVTFNVSWRSGGTAQSVAGQTTYHQPNFHYDQNLSGALQLTVISGNVSVDGVNIPVDPSTPAFWNTNNSRNDHYDPDGSSVSSSTQASAASGYWTGYWTWNPSPSPGSWVWTWVWVTSSGWVVS